MEQGALKVSLRDNPVLIAAKGGKAARSASEHSERLKNPCAKRTQVKAPTSTLQAPTFELK